MGVVKQFVKVICYKLIVASSAIEFHFHVLFQHEVYRTFGKLSIQPKQPIAQSLFQPMPAVNAKPPKASRIFRTNGGRMADASSSMTSSRPASSSLVVKPKPEEGMSSDESMKTSFPVEKRLPLYQRAPATMFRPLFQEETRRRSVVTRSW